MNPLVAEFITDFSKIDFDDHRPSGIVGLF